MRKLQKITVSLAVVLTVGSGAALAQVTQSDPPAVPPAVNPPPTPSGPVSQGITDKPTLDERGMPRGQAVLSEDEIKQRLSKEGYTKITELRRMGPSYEAKAEKDGKTVNLTVDAATGSIRSTY